MKVFFGTLLLVCSLTFPRSAFSQSKFDWDRMVYGGNFGAGFSSYETFVAVSPTVGYRFTDRFTAGPGVIYQYYKFSDRSYRFTSNNYGYKLFANYLLTESLFAHTEYEMLDLKVSLLDPAGNRHNERRRVPALFVGGGFRQRFGYRSVVDIMVLYNVIDSPYSPYGNPIIRVGFGVGL